MAFKLISVQSSSLGLFEAKLYAVDVAVAFAPLDRVFNHSQDRLKRASRLSSRNILRGARAGPGNAMSTKGVIDALNGPEIEPLRTIRRDRKTWKSKLTSLSVGVYSPALYNSVR